MPSFRCDLHMFVSVGTSQFVVELFQMRHRFGITGVTMALVIHQGSATENANFEAKKLLQLTRWDKGSFLGHFPYKGWQRTFDNQLLIGQKNQKTSALRLPVMLGHGAQVSHEKRLILESFGRDAGVQSAGQQLSMANAPKIQLIGDTIWIHLCRP